MLKHSPFDSLGVYLVKKIVNQITDTPKTEPTVSEKVKTIFSDTKTEGRKAGYARAASEYRTAYEKIKIEYDKYKCFLARKKKEYNTQAISFIEELDALRAEKDRLHKKVETEKRRIVAKGSLSVSDINKGLSGSSIAPTGPTLFEMIDMAYSAKERQRIQAEKEEYLEAKRIFEKKLGCLRADLVSLKEDGNTQLNEYIDMINNLMADIATETAQLAELKAMM